MIAERRRQARPAQATRAGADWSCGRKATVRKPKRSIAREPQPTQHVYNYSHAVVFPARGQSELHIVHVLQRSGEQLADARIRAMEDEDATTCSGTDAPASFAAT